MPRFSLPAQNEKLAYNIDEAAAILGLSAGTVRNLLASGRLGYTTAANRVLIRSGRSSDVPTKTRPVPRFVPSVR